MSTALQRNRKRRQQGDEVVGKPAGILCTNVASEGGGADMVRTGKEIQTSVLVSMLEVYSGLYSRVSASVQRTNGVASSHRRRLCLYKSPPVSSRKWLSKWKEYRKGRNGNGIADAKTEIGDKTVIEV
jgi:hypothetical protein